MLRLRFLVVSSVVQIVLAVTHPPEGAVECGKRNQTTVWPFHVGLYRTVGEETLYFCGGTIVNRWLVVGSAHCVQPHPAELLSVRYGTYDLTQPDRAERCRVAKIVVHPGYRAPDFRNDLALLQLRDPLPIGPLAQPVCLLPPATDPVLLDPEGVRGTSVGWGVGPQNVYTRVLLVSDVEAYPQSRCKELLSAKFFENNEFFCAVTPVCSGSGGSGFYVQEDGRYYLRGMTTFGVAPKGSYVCGINTLTGLINMEQYTAWIQQYIGESRTRSGSESVEAQFANNNSSMRESAEVHG
uniref:Peptidase S1 domain-containing protein n=1 Tax=Anopheles atroparvus TaxID=41427 RepID=A0AAG5D379_ANOAO